MGGGGISVLFVEVLFGGLESSFFGIGILGGGGGMMMLVGGIIGFFGIVVLFGILLLLLFMLVFDCFDVGDVDVCLMEVLE